MLFLASDLSTFFTASALRLGNVQCVNRLSTRAAVVIGGSQLLMSWMLGKDKKVAEQSASSRNRCWYWSFGCNL